MRNFKANKLKVFDMVSLANNEPSIDVGFTDKATPDKGIFHNMVKFSGDDLQVMYHLTPHVKYNLDESEHATRQLGLMSLSKNKLARFVDFGRKLSMGANIK